MRQGVVNRDRNKQEYVIRYPKFHRSMVEGVDFIQNISEKVLASHARICVCSYDECKGLLAPLHRACIIHIGSIRILGVM